jgi:hypothetical protein
MRGLKLITRNNIRMYSTPHFNKNYHSKKNYTKNKDSNYENNKTKLKESYLYMYKSLPIKPFKSNKN